MGPVRLAVATFVHPAALIVTLERFRNIFPVQAQVLKSVVDK